MTSVTEKYTRLVKIYEAMILPVVLQECETGSLTLKEERRLKVFAKRVLRRIFRSKREKTTQRSLVIYTAEQILFGSSV